MAKKAVFDKSLKIRCDDRILEWVNQLAAEANRTPSQFLRDLIFYARITKAGGILCAALIDQQVKYRPISPRFVDPPIVKPIFPWQPGNK